MPALFSLPKAVPLSSAGALLPGAKLYFYATGTSTPQNTYTDIDLSVAHENPVVADSEGVFAPIYLDPTLPHYRVKLTTSADVQIWQIDDVPSNQNTAQTFKLSSTAPELIFEETDASANNKKWRIRASGEKLLFELLNDAESVVAQIAEFSRSGTTPGTVNFGDGYLEADGEAVAAITYGQFSAGVTGFSDVSSLNCHYVRTSPPSGGFATVTLVIPAFTGTSNATTFTLTGIPAGAASTAGATVPCYLVDNGSAALGTASIGDSGSTTVTFGLAGASGGFTNSGNKGISSGAGGNYIVLTYLKAV